LVDTELQKYKPSAHYIIEAHPDVHAEMLRRGWGERPGVTILFGRWQDVVSTLEVDFDGIFFDTYGEFYDDLKSFHERAVDLLKADGVYTWFNGLGATNRFFHDVYCRISEMDLRDMGLSTEYVEIPFNADEEDIWNGVRQRYYVLDSYRLPICRFLLE
jgi:protein arginine N-methyltransferase 2